MLLARFTTKIFTIGRFGLNVSTFVSTVKINNIEKGQNNKAMNVRDKNNSKITKTIGSVILLLFSSLTFIALLFCPFSILFYVYRADEGRNVKTETSNSKMLF